MTSGEMDSANVPRISTLVRRKIDAGVSARRLSAMCDGVVSHQQFTQLAKGQIKAWPKNTATITALAKALTLDPRAVVLGFAVDLGLDVRESRSMLAAQLPAAATHLSPEQAATLARLAGWLGASNEPSDSPRVRRLVSVQDAESAAEETVPDAAWEEPPTTPPGRSEAPFEEQ